MTLYGLYYTAAGRHELCESFWQPPLERWVCYEAFETEAEADKRIDEMDLKWQPHYVVDQIPPGRVCYLSDNKEVLST